MIQPGELELFKAVLTGSIYEESAWTLFDSEIIDPRRSWRARSLCRALRCLGRCLRHFNLGLVRFRGYNDETRRLGRDWPLVGYSMIGRVRLDHLQQCVETVLAEGVPGDFIETGVWRGGACMLIKAVLDVRQVRDRTVWLADSFAGLPHPRCQADGQSHAGFPMLAVSAAAVRRNFDRFGLLDDRVRFLEGWFADTLPAAPIDRLALLRLDGDLYHSTMDALRSLYDRVQPGGFVIVDDYHEWESSRRAVHDFLEARRETVVIQPIDGCGVFWRKGVRA